MTRGLAYASSFDDGNFTYSFSWSVPYFLRFLAIYPRKRETFLHIFTINTHTHSIFGSERAKTVLPMVSGFFFIIVFYSLTDHEIKLCMLQIILGLLTKQQRQRKKTPGCQGIKVMQMPER